MVTAADGPPVSVIDLSPPSPFERSSGRRSASPEAVARRRANRAAATAFRHGMLAARPSASRAVTPNLVTSAAMSPAAERHRRVARRMAVRFAAGVAEMNMLTLDYRYWQACRCGWDVRAKEFRTVGHDPRTGQAILCEPIDTDVWRWWTAMHYETRDVMMKMSQFRLLSGMKSTGRQTQAAA